MLQEAAAGTVTNTGWLLGINTSERWEREDMELGRATLQTTMQLQAGLSRRAAGVPTPGRNVPVLVPAVLRYCLGQPWRNAGSSRSQDGIWSCFEMEDGSPGKSRLDFPRAPLSTACSLGVSVCHQEPHGWGTIGQLVPPHSWDGGSPFTCWCQDAELTDCWRQLSLVYYFMEPQQHAIPLGNQKPSRALTCREGKWKPPVKLFGRMVC